MEGREPDAECSNPYAQCSDPDAEGRDRYAEGCGPLLALRADILVDFGRKLVTRKIDFFLELADRSALLEVKYGLPRRAGDALTRLLGQITEMVASGEGQAVVWSLREPTYEQMNLVLRRLPAVITQQVQFVHGVRGLWQWLTLFFGSPQ